MGGESGTLHNPLKGMYRAVLPSFAAHQAETAVHHLATPLHDDPPFCSSDDSVEPYRLGGTCKGTMIQSTAQVSEAMSA